MNSLLAKVAPRATHMIRMDHASVLGTFHQFERDTSPSRKRVLADTVCFALEIHAQLEEEIFYPAMREAGATGHEFLDEAKPEHDAMRAHIAQLRAMRPTDPQFDDEFMALMRAVMHHVADEETQLLPEAERVLGPERLAELGAQMTRRRMQLAAPHAGEMAVNTVRTMPASTMLLAAGALVAGSLMVNRAMRGSRADRDY